MDHNTNSSHNIYREREERRYSVPHEPNAPLPPAASEDLHAWSIYRQNLNSDFTDSALGSSDKSPLPYGNFQLRDTTVQSIINHPRYGPKSLLGSNMYTYLKFGLPRVFPPNAGSQKSVAIPAAAATAAATSSRNYRNNHHHAHRYRDSVHPSAGSSGYDSSENETTRENIPSNLRKFKSESDFHMMNTMSPPSHSQRFTTKEHQDNIPLAAIRQANSRASIAGTHISHLLPNKKQQKHRFHSEEEILGDHLMGYDGYSRRNGAHPQYPTSHQDIGMPSKQHSEILYPNIQVQCLDILPYLRGISLQAKNGELFAVMATSQAEGTVLMETLAGLRKSISGEILINGQHMTQRMLRKICSYVAAAEKNTLDERMSVHSALNFHAALCGPSEKSDLRERVDILVEDLGLTAVRSTNVSRLTNSEKQRLSVACQLLTQASIIILDQVTANMDIFDTFFLVEYLRQWCMSGKIVIMTLQPPTFEILSMCSGVLLLSGGRAVFSGSRSDLPRHMGVLGYPCPPFKNPADYYLDLVTLDDLSAAAMLESSARIESLANAWDAVTTEPTMSAPPANLPNFIRRAGFWGQATALTKRFIVYKQPGSLLSWISKLISAAVLSIFIGIIYWDIPSTDQQLNLNDRLGYHHAIMTLCFWPLVLLIIRDVHEDRKYAEKDISLGLYGRTIYIFIQILYTILPSLCIWLAYLLPAHSMTTLYAYNANSDTGIYLYIGYMLLYLILIQSIAIFTTHLLSTKTSSAVFTVFIVTVINSVSGCTIHLSHVPYYLNWLEYISPQRWLLPILAFEEYSHETLTNIASHQLCRNKQVQHQEIIVQHPCPTPNGTNILADLMLLPKNHILGENNVEMITLIALVAVTLFLFVLTSCVHVTNVQRIFKKSKSPP